MLRDSIVVLFAFGGLASWVRTLKQFGQNVGIIDYAAFVVGPATGIILAMGSLIPPEHKLVGVAYAGASFLIWGFYNLFQHPTLGDRMTIRERWVGPTVTLYRPVGPEELELVKASRMLAFPPRLPDQPIFYPVLSENYAVKIARDWNVPASGRGYVTPLSRTT